MTNDINLSDRFWESVDQLIKQRLNGLQFDTTKLCTIVNDSKKDQGIYTVSDGSATFQAYSLFDEYKKNDSVYVQIPCNDQDQQKLIIGKKRYNETEQNDTYDKPFSKLIDITDNIINHQFEKPIELLANGNINEVLVWEYVPKNIEASTSEALAFEQDELLAGYTRLGLRAGFKSALNPCVFTTLDENNNPNIINTSITKGNYGLRLELVAQKNEIHIDESESTENVDDTQNIRLEVKLDTSNIIGNSYEFPSFFNQEILIDISEYKSISAARLYFFQENNFTNFDGTIYSPIKTYNTDTKSEEPIANNLFVSDIYIALGYDIEEFNDERVIIFSNESTTYQKNPKNPSDNIKELGLRWITKDSNSFKSVTIDDNKLNYEVRWYKYRLGAHAADKYSDTYWQYLSKQYLMTSSEHIPFWKYEIVDQNLIDYNTTYPDSLYQPNFFKTWLIPDAEEAQEQVKAILLVKNEVGDIVKAIKSNTLIFTNENKIDLDIDSTFIIDTLDALSIYCVDETYGNYLIYDEGNKLINSSQSSIPRQFEAHFALSSNTDQETSVLKEAKSITWLIPKNNTMIKVKESDLKAEGGGVPQEIEKNGVTYYQVTRTCNTDGNIYAKQTYYIDNYYSSSKANNTIICSIEKEEDKIYTATKELTFGQAGTNGSDCTFVLDFADPGIAAFNITSDDEVKIVANLYDSEGKTISEEDLFKCTFTWSWKGTNAGGSLLTCASGEGADGYTKNECKLTKVNSLDMNNLGKSWQILQCTLEGWGDYALTAYLPIPITQNVTVIENITENGVTTESSQTYRALSLEGATQIIYNTDGVPSYYKDQYRLLYFLNDSKDKVWPSDNTLVTWEIVVPNSDEKFYPTLIENKENEVRLQPTNFYISGAEDNVIINCKIGNSIIWSQPILILQNKYPSAMINKWDGELKIDSEGGTILAPRLAVGKKNMTDDENPNTFSGIMFGDWKNNAQSGTNVESYTGIYGFHNGVSSFAFKEDGTAYIGKSGSGRIEFKGDSGKIYSSSWTGNNPYGLSLDLDDGSLEIKDTTKLKYITLSANPKEGGKESLYPLSIGNNTIISSRSFRVDWDGKLYASGADISGKINIDEGGTIGAWTINADDGSLSNGITTLGTDGSITVKKSGGTVTFEVDKNGKLTATGVDISGKITLGANSTINWNAMGQTDPAVSASSAASSAALAQIYASNANDNVTALANGTYSNGTFISGKKIFSPQIEADKSFDLDLTNGRYETYSGSLIGALPGFNIYGGIGGKVNNTEDDDKFYHMLNIGFEDMGWYPQISFSSPAGAYAYFNFSEIDFSGSMSVIGDKITINGYQWRNDYNVMQTTRNKITIQGWVDIVFAEIASSKEKPTIDFSNVVISGLTNSYVVPVFG